MAELDTRMNLKTIIDYNEVYGETKDVSFADTLIKDIPSVTLLNYISGFNIKLYLNEVSTDAYNIQIQLLNNLIVKAGEPTIEIFKKVFQKHLDQQQWPIVFWQYSNLLFYELIFRNYNTNPTRDLTSDEAKKVLDAYLILNSITSARFKITTKEVQEAAAKEETESILLPNFIYQKDYTSTTDFSNQITRSIKIFEYLEQSDKFKDFVQDYYKHLRVKDYKDLIYNILTIFTQVGIGEHITERKQIIPLGNLLPLINIDYINSLSINDTISTYSPDNSFRTLRNKMLYHFDKYIYFLLDINFLIDQLYKAQIFSFKKFIENKGYQGNFLSVKGKEFMEDIYFRLIMEKCFPNFIRKSGDDAKKNDGNEICDYYLRKGDNIILIEFKDILLSADLKEKSDKELLYSEFEKKFFENQKKDPKGIQQLYNAVKYIENNALFFDEITEEATLNIYPIVVYTDLSFGYEGINKILKKKFSEMLSSETFTKTKVKDVTFINLSYFEIHEDYLNQEFIELFKFIEEYHQHTQKEQYRTTPFEVYSRFYLKENIKTKLGNPSFMLEVLKQIIPPESHDAIVD
ncbi:hypothetical protein [Lunatibacter salilacus]|uniref:hypothetical protein n=1 Tax=Lunatibacter salilacus TaxID=2483804 RepID=UPI00131DB440|nr:hypothetical protein [Lunatibacter salilacus]